MHNHDRYLGRHQYYPAFAHGGVKQYEESFFEGDKTFALPPKSFATKIIDPSLGINDNEIFKSLKESGALFDIDDVLDVEERWWTKFSTWEFDRNKLYRDIVTYLETNRLSL